jgi:hypothetical protein
MSVRETILTAAVVWAFGSSGAARAADLPVPYSTAPAAMASGVYASGNCAGCPSAPSRFAAHHKKPALVVGCCPGSCFGYFPTQWRKWDEACPPAYQVIGDVVQPPYLPPASDRAPAGKKNGDGLPPPRGIDPKNGIPMPPPAPGVGTLPSIPLYPGLGSKF